MTLEYHRGQRRWSTIIQTQIKLDSDIVKLEPQYPISLSSISIQTCSPYDSINQGHIDHL
jgi:hypothetical protein